MALLIQIYSQLSSQPKILPVTIVFLFLNIYVHFGGDGYSTMEFLGHNLKSIKDNCIRPDLIIRAFSYRSEVLLHRIILPAFIHVDDIHLYYNMLSFTWKGIQLEPRLGSERFLLLIVYSIFSAHTLFVLIAWSLDALGVEEEVSGMYTCAVGFSAVLFSLKYILNQMTSSDTSNGSIPTSRVYGMEVSLKYACWVELVVISLITPNASFIGHLSGILAGMIYLKCTSYFNQVSNTGTRYTYTSAFLGRSSSTSQVSSNDIPIQEDEDLLYCEEDNQDAYLSSRSGNSNGPTPLTSEELRQQRIKRFEDTKKTNRKTKIGI